LYFCDEIETLPSGAAVAAPADTITFKNETMRVALFIPCYVNAVFPEVGTASLQLLKQLGVEVDYPEGQTCCGQPMGNAGFEADAKKLAQHFDEVFSGYDYVVGPSASCVSFVRDHYGQLVPHRCQSEQKVYEICEFIHDVVRPTHIDVSFPHKVSLQNSCHGVRLLGLSAPSERMVPHYNKLRNLLSLVRDIEIVEPERRDECCGFGGMFAVEESAVSAQMGRDKVARHIATGAEYIVGADCSCLMHQNGIIRREGLNIKTLHIAQILSGNV
jgi:L-lactate dehydrogenase complex protein LldE